MLEFILEVFPLFSLLPSGPTEVGAVLRSNLLDGRCQVKSSVVLVELVVWSFTWFSPKLA